MASCTITLISLEYFVVALSITSFIMAILYMLNEIKDRNPKRFKPPYYNPSKKIKSNRFDFELMRGISSKAFYFSSMIFVFSSIIIYIFMGEWPYDLREIMTLFGFNVFVVSIYIIQDIYNYTEDMCDDEAPSIPLAEDSHT